jgi:hypothetical protein
MICLPDAVRSAAICGETFGLRVAVPLQFIAVVPYLEPGNVVVLAGS